MYLIAALEYTKVNQGELSWPWISTVPSVVAGKSKGISPALFQAVSETEVSKGKIKEDDAVRSRDNKS